MHKASASINLVTHPLYKPHHIHAIVVPKEVAHLPT